LLTYYGQQIRTVDGRNPWWYMWREIAYVPTLLLPGSLRGSTQDILGTWPLVLLVALLAVLGVTVLMSVLAALWKDRGHVRGVLELITVSVVTAITSVYFNGNLNQQYVLIPFVTMWTAVILSVSMLLRDPVWRPWGQVATMGAVFVFIFSSIGMWKNDYHDQFFGPTFGTDLGEAIKASRLFCVNKESGVEVNLTGYSILLPCEVIRTLR
jgi:hypothetical protein